MNKLEAMSGIKAIVSQSIPIEVIQLTVII